MNNVIQLYENIIKYYSATTVKHFLRRPTSVVLQRKIEWQWKIENCSFV